MGNWQECPSDVPVLMLRMDDWLQDCGRIGVVGKSRDLGPVNLWNLHLDSHFGKPADNRRRFAFWWDR